eukprot:TRINITY_DN8608_c0_g1_i3.p1 TRINITY_DN8608_c0_g1~~TRINITY_DN8608_c0_g1_i3.p1  ORF type:complete len:344 (+),score=73.19 TRINITY_DN8608_c0_g1_i3:76-1107(+)
MSIDIRLATVADRDEILGELSDGIYTGNDYLPFYLDGWLANDHHICFVAVADAGLLLDSSTTTSGEVETSKVIVGHSAIGLFDQRSTAVFQALRVHPRCRGQGLAKRLTQHLLDYVMTGLSGTVKRLRIATVCHFQTVLKLHRSQGYVDRANFGSAVFRIPAGFAIRSAPEPALHVTRCRSADLWQMLQKGNTLERLCPSGLAYHNWEPYTMTLPTLTELEQHDNMFFSTIMDGESLRAFAIGIHCPRTSGMQLTINVFCEASDHEAVVSLSLHALRTAGHACMAMTIDFPYSFWQEMPSLEDPSSADPRRPPVMAQLKEKLPMMDWEFNYINGYAVILEKNL